MYKRQVIVRILFSSKKVDIFEKLLDFHRRKCQFLEKNYTIQKSYSKNKKSSTFHFRSKNDGIMVIFGSGAESRPAWTRMVAVVYGSEGGELGFPSVAQ